MRYALTFAASGPAIGLLTALGIASVHRLQWPGFGLVLGYTVAAYALFAGSAAATGACVAVVAGFVDTAWKLYVASAVIGALSPAIGPVILLLTPAPGELGPPIQAVGSLPWFGALGAVASPACTRVMKGLRPRREDGPPSPPRGASPGSGP